MKIHHNFVLIFLLFLVLISVSCEKVNLEITPSRDVETYGYSLSDGSVFVLIYDYKRRKEFTPFVFVVSKEGEILFREKLDFLFDSSRFSMYADINREFIQIESSNTNMLFEYKVIERTSSWFENNKGLNEQRFLIVEFGKIFSEERFMKKME